MASSLASWRRSSPISYHGYLYLESQIADDYRRREEDGSLKRKPLKACKEISAKNARVIPLRDKDISNILAIRYKVRLEYLVKQEWGSGQEKLLVLRGPRLEPGR